MNATPFFEVEQIGRTVVVTNFTEMDEFTFDEIVAEGGEVFERLAKATAENVVVDFHGVSRCQSTALGFFVKLAKRTREAGGRMAFYNLSETMQEIMRLTRLDAVWAICDSRADAIAEVEK